jgi:hypothetical protein
MSYLKLLPFGIGECNRYTCDTSTLGSCKILNDSFFGGTFFFSFFLSFFFLFFLSYSLYLIFKIGYKRNQIQVKYDNYIFNDYMKNEIEDKFEGSILETEIRNSTGDRLKKFHQMIIIAYLGNEDSQFWQDAIQYIERKVNK